MPVTENIIFIFRGLIIPFNNLSFLQCHIGIILNYFMNANNFINKTDNFVSTTWNIYFNIELKNNLKPLLSYKYKYFAVVVFFFNVYGVFTHDFKPKCQLI